MDHENKSKEELIKELHELRQLLRNTELERFELEKTLLAELEGKFKVLYRTHD